MNVTVRYFAMLREQSQLDGETLTIEPKSLAELFEELKRKHGFTLPMNAIRVAVNGSFVPSDGCCQDGDEIVFIPPVAGG